MGKTQEAATQNSASEGEESPWVVSRGTTKMVLEVNLSKDELAAIDAQIHALMDMESQVEFHLDMFKKQLGGRLKKLIARRLALHNVWKKGKGREVIDVEVIQDDRSHEVRRVRIDTGETVTKRTLDQREQMELFNGSTGPSYLPELDNTTAKQFAAEQQNEKDELDKLLADIDWNQIQTSIAEQLGLTIEELAASAGDRSAKASKKNDGQPKKRGKKSADKHEDNAEEGGDDVEEES